MGTYSESNDVPSAEHLPEKVPDSVSFNVDKTRTKMIKNIKLRSLTCTSFEPEKGWIENSKKDNADCSPHVENGVTPL